MLIHGVASLSDEQAGCRLAACWERVWFVLRLLSLVVPENNSVLYLVAHKTIGGPSKADVIGTPANLQSSYPIAWT